MFDECDDDDGAVPLPGAVGGAVAGRRDGWTDGWIIPLAPAVLVDCRRRHVRQFER